MAVKDAAPEDVAALPQDFTIPSYNENNKPLYDNQLFPAVNSVDDLVARGYATPDGQVTENGQMALSLKKVGALNDDYTLNDTGKAMMASREDLLKEENLPLYMKSKELDLDGTGELSWGEVGSNFFNQLKEGGKNLIDLASFDTSSMTPEQQAEFQLKSQAAGSGFVKAGATLATGVAQIIGTGTVKALVDDEETQKTAQALLDQKVEKVSDDINNTNTAEFIDAIGEMSGVNLNLQEGREQAIALVGEEKAQEFERAGESAGGFAAMFNPYGPSMLTAKVAFGVAGKGLGAAFQPISRSLLQADAKAAEVLAKTKQLSTLQRQASGLQLATQAAEKQAATAESMAQKFSQAGFTDRANNALRLANQARTKGQEAAVRLGGFTDEIATVSDDLAKATQSATVADKVLQMTQKAGQIPYLPITLLGKSLEYTGRGMIGIDKGLSNLAAKVGADKAYNAMNKITTLSGLGGVGVATGFGPAAFIPAAIKATWSTAPFIKATGEYVGLMGKEAMKARGQIGFWKRMYEMPNKGPMHRAVSGLMDTATLGGRVTGAAGRVGKGLAASYPVDLAFEWVAEGGEMNPNVLKQAAVETLVFGGTGAALGGITMGSAARIRSLQNGDATNFYRSITDPSQRVMFNGMAPDLKRAIGTFSASNPGAKVEFVTQGEGVYDRNTKTVMVNPNARNPLKPLLTHEFMHHMLNNGIGDGVVAQLVGDGYQTGGILRSKDGGYEQQYEEFKSEYVNRLRQQHERNIKLRDAIGDPVSKSERAFQVPDEKYLAEEYFIETNVDDMLGLVESGKLGKMAGRMVLNDKVRALGDAILNKSAILRDLHFRIGGVMDKQGKMVKGNGFLGGQLYQSPEIRRMFNKMVNESVGRRGGIDAAKMKARNGIELPISGKNDPILGEMSSLWESDADGNPLIDKNGDYIPLSKQTDELRSQAGMLLVDDLRARQSRGEAIPDGELAYNPENNTWSGQYLNDRQINLLSLSGRFNSKQIKQLKLMNEAARATSDPNADPAGRGHRFSVIYQPALKKNRQGQWRYDQIKPQLRDVVPYGVEISKDGNILIRIMSTNQLFANASEKAATKRGRSLYDGNMDSILRDANAIIDLHGKNQATDAYFKDKYGAQWASHKEFINSVFGNVGKGHKDINPLVASDRVDAVVKSYRLDRMNKATQLVGATQLPYQNNLIKINYLPEGEPILDANGEPKDLRYTPRYEERMPEQRQMPEVSPENLNPVANKQEAQGLWADGKRMFALNEMDEKVTPITSKAMLDSYSADAIGWMEPEQATAPSQRFMPEKLDADYMKAVESGDVGAQQRLVDEAARKAGYSIGPVFHGTDSNFNEFKKTGDVGFHFGTKKQASYRYGKNSRIIPAYLKSEKSVQMQDHSWDDPDIFLNKVNDVAKVSTKSKELVKNWNRLGDERKKTDWLELPMDEGTKLSYARERSWRDAAKEAFASLRDDLLASGIDAIRYDNKVEGKGESVIVLTPNQIKSADPITRDDSGNIIPPSKRFDMTSKDLRFMPEKEIPVAKTTSESLEESDNKELKSTGVDVPESVDDQSVISSAIKVANSQPWRKGRDFKLDLQRRVLEAAKQAGVNISERTLESIEYLARVGFKDALIALEQNPNAIGWYDEKTKQALGVMSLLFPEIATDENARFAFTWALAVTSNGLKVDKNFELAERVYRQYRKTGKMPTDIKAGQAQKAINKSLDLFNQLTDEWGINNTRQFMQTEFTVGEISRLGVVSKADKKEVKPGGEHSDTIVRGSAILGPKIGNGFFSNLYGLFDALTMDRWLVRTWGRWTGTLVEFNPELTQKAKTRLEETLAQLTPEDKSRMDQAIGKDVSSMTTEDLAFAIQKASMKPKLREVMNATATGEEFRMAGNGLAKYLDGQKEAPANPAERNFIREIFGLVLDELKSDAKYADLTMADLQAVLWYAEKRLYETAKVKADQDAIDSSDADGYEDDEAPDYANAAIGVARENGVSSKRINEVLEKIKNDNATITQPSDEGRSDAETKQQESAGGFAGKQKQKFKQYIAVTTTRRNRTGNEKALWSYQTKSGVDSGDAGVLKPKAKKNLGVKYISEWKPGRKLATIFRNNNLPTVKFLELDPKDAASAQKFADTIQQSKDESPHGAAVYVYPADEYQGMKLFLSDSGKSGFAVKPDGDIVSVFSMEKGSGRSIMEAAISAGGKKLDAFDTILPEFYGTHGFVEASRMPWNDEFAPDGWDKQAFKEFNNGEPDVVMMVLDPGFDGEYTPRKDIYTTDYDQAVEMQDAMLKKVGRKKPASKPSQPAPQKTTKKSQAKGNSSAIANAAKLK